MLCADMPLRWVMLCCAEAGLRSGTAIRVRPLDMRDGHIVILTKAGNVTNVPLSKRLAALAAAAPPSSSDDDTYVDLFAGRVWVYPEREIQKRWARWKKQCGVRGDLRLHDLRRGLARRMYRITGDIRRVQSLLSHSQIASTLHYLNVYNQAVTPLELQSAIDAPEAP